MLFISAIGIKDVVACVVGIVGHVTSLLGEVALMYVSGQASEDQKALGAVLMSLLDALHGILKYVSEVVRKALQVSSAITFLCL